MPSSPSFPKEVAGIKLTAESGRGPRNDGPKFLIELIKFGNTPCGPEGVRYVMCAPTHLITKADVSTLAQYYALHEQNMVEFRWVLLGQLRTYLCGLHNYGDEWPCNQVLDVG